MAPPLVRIVPLLLLALAPSVAVAEEIRFVQIAKLTASDGAAGDEFGHDLAISGDTAIVGAWAHDALGGSSGAAYVFERTGGAAATWRQTAKLLAPDGKSGDLFGIALAIRGERAIVGASKGSDEPGSAYIFERDAGGPGAWGLVAQVEAADGVPGNVFAHVAIDGDTAVVGASSADGWEEGAGALYVFERDAGGENAWGQTAKLGAAALCFEIGKSPSYCGDPGHNQFGSPAAIHGETVVVQGGNQSVYLFRRTPEGEWRRITTLPRPEGGNYAGFGRSVALSGETALIGAYGYYHPDLDTYGGAAFVFEPSPGGPYRWPEVAQLLAPDGEAGDYFGYSVALDGDTAAIAATHRGFGGDDIGKAYVFRRDLGGAWESVATLEASDEEAHDLFGYAIGISGETVIVGAWADDDRGTESGSAYVFQAVPRGGLARSGEAAQGSGMGPDRGLAGEPAGARSAGEAEPWSGLDRLAAGSAWWSGSDLERRERMDLPREPAAGEPLAVLAAAGASGPAPGAAASGPAPQAGPLCLSFFDYAPGGERPYCDGLELSVAGERVSGTWRPRDDDCDVPEAALFGIVEEGRVLLRCDAQSEPCPYGYTWAWVIDLPLDGTLDMFQLDGLWQSWIEEIDYTVIPGPCPIER